MNRLSTIIFVAMSMALILSVTGESAPKTKRGATVQVMSTNDFMRWICNGDSWLQSWFSCPTTTTTASTSTTTKKPDIVTESSTASSTFELPSSTTPASSTSASPSSLERAHWCRFSNGSYIPLGHTFMHTACATCQCTQSRVLRCTNLQCMTTYCIDNSTPKRRDGQCCAQCGYETRSDSCLQNGLIYPHGTIVKTTGDKMLCWCQLGNIECRKYTGSIFSSMDLWGDGSAVYVVIAVVCIVLVFGTLLCCGGSLFFYYYYYYQNNQQTYQEAYDQYYNNAGWQPMTEEEQVVDANAQEKQAEAEQSQFTNAYPAGYTEEYVPPPYALYNGPYASEQDQNPKYA